MYHYINSITNTSGDALVGYFVKAVSTTTGDVVDIYADPSGTAIDTVSGVSNAAAVDNNGNVSFYIAGGTYHLDVYATDATTFVLRVDNIEMADFTDLSGPFLPSPNYVGDGTGATFTVAQGSLANPSATQDATLIVQKIANATAFNAFASMAFKKSTAANARATGFYSETTDAVGGATSFSEGYRAQTTLTGGSGASGYGGVSVAAAATGTTSFEYLIGHESEVDNQIGPDAPTFATFNKDSFVASYVATNGNGATVYKADAAFTTNAYSNQPFRTGLLLAETTVDHTAIACRALTLVNGIDMHLATFSGFAINLPGFTIDGSGNVRSTASIGYGTGAGGTVTQATSKSTGVTLNKVCGQITMHNASLAASTVVAFTFTNSNIAATDSIIVQVNGGTADSGAYRVWADNAGSGSCTIRLRNDSGGALGEAVRLNFAIVKAVNA